MDLSKDSAMPAPLTITRAAFDLANIAGPKAAFAEILTPRLRQRALASLPLLTMTTVA
jgi:hypothetical protein